MVGFQLQTLSDLSGAKVSSESALILKAMTESPIINNLSDEMIRGCLVVCLTMSGVKQMPTEIEAKAIVKYLRTECGTMTMDEVNTAFEMNAWGKLNDRHEAFGLFDVNYISKVMNDYRFKRIEARKELERNKPKLEEAKPATDEELYNGLMKFTEFPEYYNFSAVFRHLEKTGKLVLTLEEKKGDYFETYKELSDRMTFADRANIQESEFQETVKQECRKRAVKNWYENFNCL